MKFIFILLIQCIWSTNAATPVDSSQLKKALAKYQGMSSFEVPFKQVKTLKDIQVKLESEGVLKVQFPNKVEWKVLKPQAMDMVLEQDQITLKSQDKSETFRASEGTAKDQRSFQDLLNWLKLDADALLKDYDVSQTAKNRFRFNAKKAGASVTALNMEMSPAGHLARLTFEETSGDEIRIDFGSPKVTYKKSP